MPHYVGLDVLQKTTEICVVDEQGRRFRRMLRICGTTVEGQIRPLDTDRSAAGMRR